MPMSDDEAAALFEKGKKKIPTPPDVKGPSPPVGGQGGPFRTPTDIAVNPSNASIGPPAPNLGPPGETGPMAALRNAAMHSATFGLSSLIDRHMSGRTHEEQQTKEAVERIQHPIASAAGDAIGMSVGGAGISNRIGRYVPALARNTLPAIAGNQAITGGISSGLQDIGSGQTPDWAKMAGASAAAGLLGAGGAGLVRSASPAAAIAGDIAASQGPISKATLKQMIASRIPSAGSESGGSPGVASLIGAGGGLASSHFGLGDPYTMMALGAGIPIAAKIGKGIMGGIGAGQRSRILSQMGARGNINQITQNLARVPMVQRGVTGLMSGVGAKTGRTLGGDDYSDYMFP